MRIHSLVALIAVITTPLTGCYVTAPLDGLAAGRDAPSLGVEQWVNTPGASSVELSRLRGRPVLLEFWSRDCPPCVGKVSKMKQIAASYGDALQVVTVHVNLDQSTPPNDRAIREFVATSGIEYPVGIDTGNRQWKNFQFDYLPHALILDNEGKVLWSGNLLAWSLDKALKKHIGEAPTQAPENASSVIGINESKCQGGICRVER